MELEQSKLFIGGLNPETTEDNLRSYFGSYGDVADCTLKMDNETRRSKCYGFITFDDKSAVEAVLDAGNHTIDGKTIDPKRATKQKRYGPPKVMKVFVGGVPNDITTQEMEDHFQQFGDVKEVVFPVDTSTQKRRGFAFVEFHGEGSADKACRASSQTIGDQCKSIDVKPATPRDRDNPRGGGRGGGRGRGGYGGGNDGYGGGGGYNQGGYGGGGYGGSDGYSDYSSGGGYGSSGGYGGSSSGGYGGGSSSGGYGGGYGGGGGGGRYGGGGGGGYGGGDYGSGGYGKAPRGGRGGGGGYHPYGQ